MTGFDPTPLRRVCQGVVAGLPGEVRERFAQAYESPDDLVDAMVAAGDRAWRHLDKRGRSVPPERYQALALALLSVRNGPVDVQTNLTNVAAAYDRLLPLGELPLDVAVQCRLTTPELAARLVVAYRVAQVVRARRPGTQPLFVDMVTCAVVGFADAADAADIVDRVLDRANPLAAAYRYRRSLDPNPRAGVQGGYTDLVGQIAGYRVAVAEARGYRSADVEATVDEYAERVADDLHRGLTRPPAVGRADEPDSLVTLRGFAGFVAADHADDGREARTLFRLLAYRLPGEVRPERWKRDVPVAPDEARDRGDLPVPGDDGTPDADLVADAVLAELYADTGAADTAAIDEWLLARRAPDGRDDLLVLVDRVRRVDRLLSRPGPDKPRPGVVDPRVRQALRDRIADALTLRLRGTEIAQHILPPLWTEREYVVHFAEARLRVDLPPGTGKLAKAALLANAVVRAPAQPVHRAADPDRRDDCACGTPDRTPPAPAAVCPHRTWWEAGRVEDYTTLARVSGLASEDAVRNQLARHTGFWREWVEEIRTG
ncbi:hypothetical protein GCM10022243_34390 [Saccharothrix violaceirubra]|uniref:Uncharacterized protein n=1 Tax=Saccharothrix violaceirubra TaxID=413306 RepID=A0A7W7T4N5_9PSEU|nr:hypothetical protein [Saccharothrix violaceirubra]MBB4966490.1 hypothetical protein [Saccharothrix violaceirubra]